MKLGKLIVVVFNLFLISSFLATANAKLIDNEDGTVTQIRNDGSSLMWLKDANYSKTSGYTEDSYMTWDQAQEWIASLNRNNYLGYNDWRLPATLPVNGIKYVTFGDNYNGSVDHGYNITNPNSELAYMFYTELDNKGHYDTDGELQTDFGLKNRGPFKFKYIGHYWSGNTSNIKNTSNAWAFTTYAGIQALNSQNNPIGGAWAVRDVEVPPDQ